MVQIGKAALHQGADEIQSKGRALIAAQQQLRIGRASFRSELRAVDVVAAETGEGDAVARFFVGGARLGILAGETADADDRFLRAHHQNQAHLQQHLEHVGDAAGSAGGEAFGAIAGLQDEARSGGGLSQLLPQLHDFPTGDQGRQDAQLIKDAAERRGVRIFGLLQGRRLAPGIGQPGRNLRGNLGRHEVSS